MQPPSTANLTNAPTYEYIISLGQNEIEGGFVLLAEVYFNQLLKNYQ
jgi:hypothetical protein